MKTLSTGIEVLDRKLDGGIPAGRVISLSASPVSQSELFLYEMASVRSTVYVTTERSNSDIRESLNQTGTSLDRIDINHVGTSDPIEEAGEAIASLPEESTLIIDPLRLLEETEVDDYVTFLNDLKSVTAETGSVAVLHCLDGRQVPAQRDRTEYFADIIFTLSTRVRGGTVQNNLAVPKFRGGQALQEAINLDLTADVTIDVTRKIA